MKEQLKKWKANALALFESYNRDGSVLQVRDRGGLTLNVGLVAEWHVRQVFPVFTPGGDLDRVRLGLNYLVPYFWEEGMRGFHQAWADTYSQDDGRLVLFEPHLGRQYIIRPPEGPEGPAWGAWQEIAADLPADIIEAKEEALARSLKMDREWPT